MTPPDLNVAAELARLRGDMTTAFEHVKGQLALIAQAQGQDRTDLDDLNKRVMALEARRVPVPLLAAVSGAVSALVAAVALLLR
jgi:hypothetical protein